MCASHLNAAMFVGQGPAHFPQHLQKHVTAAQEQEEQGDGAAPVKQMPAQEDEQGEGAALAEMKCTACVSSDCPFVRRPPAETERLFSPKRLEVEERCASLQLALKMSAMAEEAATARALATEEARLAADEANAQLRAEIALAQRLRV